jgi:predicted DsbA family dithiol-disulfide isomerase
MRSVPILYFSDLLCVWAYIAQLRLDAVQSAFGRQVTLERRFCSVFGDTASKIGAGWTARGGYDAYADHVREAAAAFPEAPVSRKVWREARPASSMSPHIFLKAVQLAEASGACAPGAFEQATWAARQAFFVDGRDIASADVQRDVARGQGLDADAIDAFLRDGRAHAALSADYQEAAVMGVQGSPSFVLNEGRQKLYGNVGYRIIEANIQELLREPHPDHASWC